MDYYVLIPLSSFVELPRAILHYMLVSVSRFK